MTQTQQPEALRLAEILEQYALSPLREVAAELRRQHARIAELEDATGIAIECIAELESQLSAIGAGGVEPLRKREEPAALVARQRELLAADHSGMKVDYRGLLYHVQRALKRTSPGHADMLRQLECHLQELGQRWYAGDTNVVDEFLQLYCIEHDARKTVSVNATAAPQAHPDTRDAERYRWLRNQMLGIDFDWCKNGITALAFEMPDGCAYGGDCDQNIDTAIAAQAKHGDTQS